jgi:hypothetical protein
MKYILEPCIYCFDLVIIEREYDPPVEPLGETSIGAAQPEHDLSAIPAPPTH